MPTATYEKAQQLRERTKKFAYRVYRLCEALPRATGPQIVGKQLLRSGMSVGANYRSACRSRSSAEFAARIGVVLEEADESLFWLELIVDNNIVPVKRVSGLLQEARELTAIFTASRQTAKG
jgi:four helix bundle protein